MKITFLDWMDQDLHVYEFVRTASDYELSESRSYSIEDGLTSSLLSTLLENTPDELYLSLPLNLISLREESFPFSDKKKIRDTIAYELEGLLLESIDSYSIDHIITDSTDAGSKVMAICLEKIKLQEILSTFADAGLDPKVITSIDLWLYGNKGEDFLGAPITDKSVRIETARKELDSPSVNLRQDELAYTGDVERLKKSLRVTSVLVLVLLVLIGLITTMNLIAAKNEEKTLTDQMNTLYRTVFPAEKRVVDVARQFKGNYNNLKNKKEALAGLPMLDILLETAVNNDRAARLHELSADGKQIIIKGSADSFEDVEDIKNRFAKSFNKVKVADSSSGADKKVAFTLQMLEKKL